MRNLTFNLTCFNFLNLFALKVNKNKYFFRLVNLKNNEKFENELKIKKQIL